MKNNKQLKMRELVKGLNEARRVYEQENREIMSNLEYDKLYDELLTLEQETGTTLSNSPTSNVGYEIQSTLPKEAHNTVMLSLDKTKYTENLVDWLGEQDGLLSWKLDGITMVLTYEDGKLTKGVTRGNGQIGEVVTGNVKVFDNLPLVISHKGRLVIRGEAIIPYSEFEKINKKIKDVALKYKNPRNLCSGTVRQLNNEITAQRNVNFFAFSVVESQLGEHESRTEELEFLKDQGFNVVEYVKVKGETLVKEVEKFKEKIIKNDLPSDGLVLIFNNITFGKSLGVTSKFPKDAIAFKWGDEIAETTLREIEWNASRTGLINPIAIFDPVELEGTTVSRASVHNLSILEELKLDVGDKIGVYKANMIIPQISENFSITTKSNWSGLTELAPKKCPVCGENTAVKMDGESSEFRPTEESGQLGGVKTLYCPNPQCLAKQLKAFTHFVSRNAINVDGLSEATIEKLIAMSIVKELADIFHLARFKETIVTMEGFGEKSYEKLIKAIEKSRHTTEVRLLFSLGISNIGLENAKNICRECDHDWERIASLDEESLIAIKGIGDIMAKSFVDYFQDEKNRVIVRDILEEITFEKTMKSMEAQTLQNKVFVITGSVLNFSNRKELQGFIEERGGKVTGLVTSKTDYLINNDSLSNSSKNKMAKEIGLPIITEDEFLKLI